MLVVMKIQAPFSWEWLPNFLFGKPAEEGLSLGPHAWMEDPTSGSYEHLTTVWPIRFHDELEMVT